MKVKHRKLYFYWDNYRYNLEQRKQPLRRAPRKGKESPLRIVRPVAINILSHGALNLT